MDLADPAERLQMTGELGSADRHPNSVITPGKRAHHVTAKKTRSAINSNKRIDVAAGGHGRFKGENRPTVRAPYRIVSDLYSPLQLTSRNRLNT
jgi:hypothetical protein